MDRRGTCKSIIFLNGFCCEVTVDIGISFLIVAIDLYSNFECLC